jgi:hypothetical protein
VSFAAITLCVASQRLFTVVSVYFVIDSVRKLLDTPSYIRGVARKLVLQKYLFSTHVDFPLSISVENICIIF